MADPTPAELQAAHAAANRLHHLSMRYSAALVELVANEPVGFLLRTHPGLKEARDLIDLVLLTRAEVNALTALLVQAKVLDLAAFNRECRDQYEWLTNQKSDFLGVGVSDAGIVITPRRPGT
jgi:hypothetical protein